MGMKKKITFLIRLTRYKEYYGADIFVTSIGLYIVQPIEYYQMILVLIANFLSTAFAFMINDIEDADDDRNDNKKKERNPISNGSLSKNEAYIGSLALAIISLLIYSYLNPLVLLLGTIKVILGFIYSWKRIRLKAMPVTDILSHVTFGFLCYLITLALFPSRVSILEVVLIGGAISLSTALGDIKNQIRDFKVDQESGLKNTASYLNLIPFKKYLDHSEIVVLLIIIIYLVLNLPPLSNVFFITILVGTSVHYYKTWLSKDNLVLDYPQRQISFTLISIVLLLS